MTQPIAKPVPVRRGDPRARSMGIRHPDAVAIYIDQRVLSQVIEYSESDMTGEVGGFLLGGLHEDGGTYVEVRAFLPAPSARSGRASLTFTHETWAQLNRQVEADYPDQLVLGWQHTHPGLTVFLSGYDVFIHRNFFSQPWQIALVVDPKAKELSFFQWRAGEIVDCGFTIADFGLQIAD